MIIYDKLASLFFAAAEKLSRLISLSLATQNKSNFVALCIRIKENRVRAFSKMQRIGGSLVESSQYASRN